MTIKELITNDFQELFPSIIGEGENKLSINDLMETSHDYIIKELHNIKEGFNPTETAELISFMNLMEVSDMDIEYDSHIHYRLKRLSERYPNHKSFRFFLYRYLLCTSFNNEEYSLENVIHLINRITTDTLFELTDFVTVSGFGNAIITLIEVSIELVTILQDAVSHYPQKITLLWITAHLYRIQENYQEAIRYNKLFLQKLESMRNSESNEEIDTDYVDDDSEQMVCFQLSDLHFDIGDYTNALYYCNKVLNQGKGETDSENVKFYYFDTLIIRIRIHMLSNDTKAFQRDYDELLKVVSKEELKENYLDILNYADLLKNQHSSDK